MATYTTVAPFFILLSTLYLQTAPSPQEEIVTEVLSWALILICGVAYLHLSSNSDQSSRSTGLSSTNLNTVALWVALLCLSSSVREVNWSLAPLLIPLVFVTQRIEVTSLALPVYEDFKLRIYNANKKTSISLGLFACATILVLVKNNPLESINLQVCWLIAQAGLYVVLHHRASNLESAQLETEKPGDFQQLLQTATQIAPRVLALTGPIVLIWGRGFPFPSEVAITILLKSARWMTVLTLVSTSKISIVPLATAFAVLTNAIGQYTHGYQSFLVVLAALTTLYLITVATFQYPVARSIVLAFAIFPVRSFLISEESSLPISYFGSHRHPIYHLAQEARGRFQTMQNRQSKTLADAVAEYTRRYERLPPSGFDKWYEFAITNNVTFVDEYDYMTHSVDPFWQVTPATLRDYLKQAVEMNPGSSRLGVLKIEDHKASQNHGGFQHDQLVELLQPVLEFLPDMTMLLNALDEPRIIVPHDMLGLPETPTTSHTAELADTKHKTKELSFSNLSHQKAFNMMALSCPPDSPARSPIDSLDQSVAIPFISNITAAQDICQFPDWKANEHGMLSTPSSFIFTHQRVPVASTSKLSTFHDMLIPSSYYFQGDIVGYEDSWDPDWDEKEDKVYWRGSGSGGQWHDGSWRHGHRQRFVNFTNTPEQDIRLLNQTNPGAPWKLYNSVMNTVADLFKVNFSQFFQCEGNACSEQEQEFDVAAKDQLQDSYKYKILYNLDGNSFSGRYYRFLKSKSLVFMQNVFKEWHEDRLIPWVHYVPIGLGMEELPETARYLLQDAEGKEIAARIAKDSREWAERILRPVDLSAALLRSLLEYNRLFQDDRGVVGCCDGKTV
ncbi:Beta-1,2-xylosyltransferase [Lachnellula suecica]|uniref:Beta-1,2-xylosyltransferase n=1 Tax=Lachnellula suecica TaxID=602035 RepID=A0A8T9BZZ3_9HELO|nr:Beta-1,2-xylosyltransferase [Lachnellula suecica]